MGYAQRQPEAIEYCSCGKDCDIYYGDDVFHAPHLDFGNKRHYVCYECMVGQVEKAAGLDFNEMSYQQHKEVMRPFIELLKFAGFELVKAE